MPVLKVKQNDTWIPLTGAVDTASISPDDIGALNIDLADTDAGDVPLINTDQLGGVGADSYALKTDVEASIETYNTTVADTYLPKTGIATDSTKFSGMDIGALKGSFFPVGSCYTTDTNTNPADLLGVGTWELIDKMFISMSSTTLSNFFTPNTTNVTTDGCGIGLVRNGHTIRILLKIKNAVALTGTNTQLGTFNFQNLGIGGTTSTLRIIGDSEGEGLSVCTINNSSGLLTNIEFIPRNSDVTSIPAEQTIYYDFIIQPTRANMLDNHCNKFIWKRTA